MDNKIKVLMHCKVGTDCFPEHEEYMTGQEIFDFLMSDLGYTHKEEDENAPIWKDPERIPGDLRLWYLGCNEKAGTLQIENEIWEWGIGDSSFDRVQDFIDYLNKRGLFTKKQYHTLCEKIIEGRKIDWMYDIGEYLEYKAQNKPWENKSKQGREESRKFFGGVFESFKSKGYEVKGSVQTQHTIEMNAEVKEGE